MIPPWIRKNALVLGIGVGALFGGFCGFVLGEKMQALDWLGQLFLNGLRLLVIPLVMASLTAGILQLNSITKLGSLGLRSILYFLLTTGIAVFIGLVLVNILKPGIGIGNLQGISSVSEEVHSKTNFSFIQVFLDMVPPNLFQAMAEGKIMPLILFSIAFGITIISFGERAKPLVDMIHLLNDVILRMVKYFMVTAPVGIFALVSSELGKSGGGGAFWVELSKVGRYSFTVILGLLIHALVILPLLLYIFKRKNVWPYLRNGAEAILTAFGTASSSATLPVTLRCLEKKNKISEEVASFVAPLGATINMDGTALYEAVAALFIAQAYGISLTLPEQILIFLTATLASIGAAGIPQAGLVTMVMVLNTVNLPLEGIGMVLAVDWFLDRCRTAVNVHGDMVGAGIIEHLTLQQSQK